MKQTFKLLLLACVLGVSALVADARMTDEQVIAYVKEATAQGKSQQQIGRELLAKGVTQEQVERLKSRFEDSDGATGETTGANQPANNGKRTKRSTDNDDVTTDDDNKQPGDSIGTKKTVEERRIFGNDIFRKNSLTFEPNENLATPKNYTLGPGDEVVIDIWGENEDHIRAAISPEGSIMVSQIGPVYLSGMTISEANSHIRNKFASKYAGISGDQPDSEINVTLGQIRTIQVDILGQVNLPGTYRLSPFSTVFHALYKAGGINEIGSLRNVHVLRNGKRIVGVDLYDYLFEGNQKNNIRLQEGDAIIVPDYMELVNIDGNVRRPMYYEMKEGETLDDLIQYAGGFTGEAYTDQVRVIRQTGRENELFNIVNGDFKTYRLQDGDMVTVGSILDRYANRVEVKGSVYRPGMYALSSDIRTVGDLIRSAEGLTEDAFTNRALLYREGPDLALEITGIDINGILSGTRPDVTLKRNDILLIPNVNELEDRGSLTIDGMVAYPGTYPYSANTSIEDLIIQAGGLLQGASTVKVDVSRRIVDPTSLMPTNQIAKIFTFSLNNGLVVKGDPDFTLQPYDIVEIRRSPGYEVQKRVYVDGEIAFGGGYTLEKRNERISDIIRRAGGVLPTGYIKGASLKRRMAPEEIATRDESLRLAGFMGNDGDSVNISNLVLPDTYNVELDLEKAMAYPGSNYDHILRDSDVIVIPEQINTVKVSGNVMFPNTLTYVKGKKAKFYVDKAGGYGQRANKGKGYIVYLNGDVARLKGNTEIQPGCQIIIPTKPKGNGVDWQAVMTIVSATGSIATMAAVVANMIKN